MEMIKTGEVILANISRPSMAYHQKLHPTNLGFVFFAAEGNDGKKGPFTIFVKIFLFSTEEI